MRDCINCRHAVIVGEHHKATLLDPPERPEVDGCGYEGPGDIERYLKLFEFKHDGFYENAHLPINIKAEYCPFYEDRDDFCSNWI